MVPRSVAFTALGVLAVLAGAVLLLDPGPVLEPQTSPRAAQTQGPVERSTALPDPRDEPASLAAEGLAGSVGPLLRAQPVQATAAPSGPLATGRVMGRVFGPGGTPLSGVPLDLLAEEDPWLDRMQRRLGADLVDRTRSDGEGRFQLAARAGTAHRLIVGGERNVRQVLDAVAAGDVLTLTLEPGLAFRGEVLAEESGEPVPLAHVGSLTASDQLVTRADESGAFKLAPVPDAPVLLAAWAPGHDVAVNELAHPGGTPFELLLPPGRPVTGVVLDAESALPVAGAELRLVVSLGARPAGQPDPHDGRNDVLTLTTETDEGGAFLFEGCPSRMFRLEVDAPGYASLVRRRWESRLLEADESVVLELIRDRVLSGVVLDGESNEPVVGVTVSLKGLGGPLGAVVSDGSGAFALPVERWPGEGPLVIDALDASGRRARHVVRREDFNLVLGLMPPLELQVLVLAAGQPVAGAQVALLSKDADPSLAVSDAQGLATLVHARSGPDVRRAHLSARSGGVVSLPVLLELDGELPTDPVPIDMALGSAVAGRVFDRLGSPVAGALVSASGGPFGRTDAQGAFRMFPLEPDSDGKLSLVVSAEGFATLESEAYPDDTQVQLVLDRVITWAVRIVDATTGMAPPDAGGRLQREVIHEGVPSWENTAEALMPDKGGESGDFLVELPEAGRYRVAAGARDRLAQLSVTTDFDGMHAPAPVDLFLSPAAVLELQLVDAARRPLPGVSVGVVPIPGGLMDLPESALSSGKLRGKLRMQRTDGSGKLRLQLGEGGRYRLATSKTEWLLDQPVAVYPGPATVVEARIALAGELQVSVFDEQGRPVPGASVQARCRSPLSVKRRLRVDSGGDSTHFEALPAGVYEVSAEAKGLAKSEADVLVISGGLARLTLLMTPAGNPEGRSSVRPKDKPKDGKTR